MSRPCADGRDQYRYFRHITTRWMDNDIYAHVNNVNYYSWFDTAVNGYLMQQQVLDLHHAPVVGLVVETSCQYLAPIAFPDDVYAGVRVARLGTSSVRYEVGLFRNNESRASAQGHFIHVYVDRDSRRPVALPENLRTALSQLVLPQ